MNMWKQRGGSAKPRRRTLMGTVPPAILALVLASPALGAGVYKIDPQYTVPSFEISHLGFTTQRGRFDKTSGTLKLDLARHRGSVDATIYTSSIDMSSPAWTAHLKEPELFDVAKFPTMTFHSDKLIFKGSTVVGAQGELTLRGITKPITVKVRGFKCRRDPRSGKSRCGGTVTGSLRRSEFGMTKYIHEVSDEIKLEIPVEAYRD
jgi:polyisoprenoid-binding protein YceI